ncbi:DUF596 domain-containing protein [Roseateles sp.]|uniref:DUF596 domain-containing protein n=1 Tax=Roseateles sp. TaxID=1971397 RepID=UPI0031DD9802
MNRERFEYIRDGIEGMELDALWDYALEASDFFDEQRQFFFMILEKLIREGNIRLIHMHTKVPMSGTAEQQIDAFMKVFPRGAEEMNGGLWFFSEECPGGSLWQAR